MFDQITSKKKPDIGGGGDVPTLQEVTTAAEKKGIKAMTWQPLYDPFTPKFVVEMPSVSSASFSQNFFALSSW